MTNIRTILDNNGIDENILNHSSKMDIDLIELFKNKVLNNLSDKTFLEVKNHLLGIFGNYYATKYYEGMNYKVENEVPVYNFDKKVMDADLSFINSNFERVYVEVKLAKQILKPRINYTDDKIIKTIDLNTRKYEEIGKKLLKQVKKLKNTNKKVIVCVFNGCIIDDEIKEELTNLDVDIHILALKVEDIQEYIENIIINIKEEYESLLSKSNKRLVF